MAEFDLVADHYHEQHAASIKLSGEEPAFFAEYKVEELSRLVRRRNAAVGSILDFGSGVGNSIPHFRKWFPASKLTCADVSSRSLELAERAYPGPENKLLLREGCTIDVPDDTFDLVFAACVFHHIPFEQHQRWLTELCRVMKRQGLLVIFEHNPLNPLTVRAVRNCPFDANARLIRASALKKVVERSGWKNAIANYRLFFPAPLAALRPIERLLLKLPLGAQYYVVASK